MIHFLTKIQITQQDEIEEPDTVPVSLCSGGCDQLSVEFGFM